MIALMVAVGAVGGTAAIVAAASVAAPHPTCNLTVNSENAGNNSLQTAINSANPGWTICVGPGSFPEQLTITTPSLKIMGVSAARTIIDPASVATTTVDWDSGAPQTPVAAVVLVANTTGVTLTQMTIDGTAAASSIGGCSPDFVGVDFQNSTGTLSAATVNGIELSPSLLGCQNQFAVYAYNGWFTTSFVPSPAHLVTIATTTITNYGKNGITCDDPGLTCAVTSSTVTGLGATTATAQNGIQVAYGASGTLSLNRVSGDDYTGAGATLDWYGNGYQASGILLYQAANSTTVARNTLSGDAMAIVDVETSASTVHITGNVISSFSGYGIVVDGAPGSSTFIGNNTVNAAATGAPGILVDNGSFNLTGNTISLVSATGTNGASQVVCGAGAFLSCPTTLSIGTAAVQAVSEGAGGPTSVTLFKNIFTRDVSSMTTLALPTGSVATQLA